ncbi:MAG TPA: FliA/WhiG family RNA polymerase sigma factor [Bryobacteraceae bacterium]|nr:FliA/WhiG family RNA polymerase sigma factor [Bryobacteraceae bacterium]
MTAAAYYRTAETLSEDEREKLILEHLPQVRLVARKIHERLPATICFDDLLSAGVVGLIQAIDHFDPRQNVKLKTYAEFRIRGSILDSLRETDWAPRLKRRQAREFEAAIARAEQRLGRTPEEAEIARELNLSIEDYRHKLTEMEALNIGELEFGRDENETPVILKYAASAGEETPDVTMEREELQGLISSSIDRIPKVEKTVLSLYFYEELTLREIAGVMGIHLSRVSQIKSQAILRLRTAIVKRWPGARA